MKLPVFFVLLSLISWTCTPVPEVDSAAKPDDNRFTKVILTQGMDEPMTMDFLPDDRIIIIERKGGVKIYDEELEMIIQVATIPVNTKYKNKEGRIREAEEGLMGVIAHPDFSENNWVFFYYADPDEPKHVLARWELVDEELVPASKTVILEIPTQREECCHTGGGMVFDKEGNLYLTVGNNTINPPSGASNLDERPGHKFADDQRGPSNTNDLRGKILRIHPEDDGSYTIPVGNLFPVGTENTRPEIYTMGHRNPWRVSLDSQTGFLYWGEVGPDANSDGEWGPKGYDEFNQARGPGFFGWPYFIGNNRPYNRIAGYKGDTILYGNAFDTTDVVNKSVNNTGISDLPAPIPAYIYYPYGPSEEFPLVGSAGRSATGGPVFRKSDFINAPRPFPAYYEGKWLIVDFMRDWIMAVTMDENGDYVAMERFLPGESFSAAIDMDFGPSGDLYILEYGDAWFRKNANSRLVKIEYNAGNRRPIVQASADKTAGALPLTVQFSSEGSMDYDAYDQNNLDYTWEIKEADSTIKKFDNANPTMVFETAGVYTVDLTVTDSKGATNKASLEIIAGNELPEVTIDLKGSNRSFYFGDDVLAYSVGIADKEDGVITDPGLAAITFDYVPSGFDPIEVAAIQAGADLNATDAVAKSLIEGSDCRSCHQVDATSIGPSYKEISKKYKPTPANLALLVNRVINGSSGIWGEHAMAAHPELTEENAGRIVNYILSVSKDKPTIASLPLAGNLRPVIPRGEDGAGVFLLRAAYRDQGANGLKPLQTETFVALRNPVFFPPFGDMSESTQYLTTPSTNYFVLGPEAIIGFNELDITGIGKVELFVDVSSRFGALGGMVELRLDSAGGELLASSESVSQLDMPRERRRRRNTNLSPEEQKVERRKNRQVLSLSFEPRNGIHNLYFVFKNPEAENQEIMMALKEMEFYRMPDL